MECQYCKNVFSNKTSLNNHQRTAKYCLKIRGSTLSENYICNGCSKSFNRKYEYNRHLSICKADDKIEKYNLQIKDIEKINDQISNQLENKQIHINHLEIIIQEQKETISKLQDKLLDKLENLAIKAIQRPTTTNMNKTQINNFIQKMEPLSAEHMLEHSQNLTLEYIQKGASGYAEYALEYPLKDRIACVDYSRRKMKFKDKDGNLITDPEMVKLAPMFFNSIKNKSSEIVYSQNDNNMDSVMFEEVANLFNMNTDVKNGADGIKSEFYHDFIKQVCSGSVVE